MARSTALACVLGSAPKVVAEPEKIFDRVGVDNYVQVKVTDLGIEKQKGLRASDDQVRLVMDAAIKVMP